MDIVALILKIATTHWCAPVPETDPIQDYFSPQRGWLCGSRSRSRSLANTLENTSAVLLLPLWISSLVFVKWYKLILFCSCTLDSIDLFGRMSASNRHRPVTRTLVGLGYYLANLKKWDIGQYWLHMGLLWASARDPSNFYGMKWYHTCSVTLQKQLLFLLLFYLL